MLTRDMAWKSDENDRARRFLRESTHDVGRRHAFEIPAIVLLPDHLHMLMRLPSGDDDYSVRIRQIKTQFTLTRYFKPLK